MSYRGDIALGQTIDVKFTSRRFTTGAPFTLAGSPVVSAYVGNGATEITAGITLSVDFDSRTGLNNVRVVATSGNGFAAQTDVDLVITTGTVDSVSVVGETIGSFSIENRSGLRPTVVGRTLDVTATGAAGVDWANVENPTTLLNLSGTNIDVDQVVASVSGAVGSVTGAVGSVTGLTAADVGAIKAKTDNLPTDPADASVVAGLISAVETKVDAIDGIVDDILLDTAEIGAAGAGLTAINLPNQTMDIVGNITGNLSGSVGSVTGAVGSVTGLTAADVGAIKAKTDNLPTDPADQSLIIAATNTILTDTNAIKVTTDKLDTALVLDGAVYQFTANALELGPSGTGLDAAATRAALGLASANLDTQLADLPTVAEFNARTIVSASYALATQLGTNGNALSAIPWNAAWDAEVQSEAADALNAYDPPTNAEMVARTLLAADYATATAVGDKTGYRLSAAGVDDILDEAASGALTLRQLLRGYAATLLGKASGLGTTTATFRDPADTKDVVVATVDASGNRTAITLDLT